MANRYLEIGVGPARNFGYNLPALAYGDTIYMVDPEQDLGSVGHWVEQACNIYPSARCAQKAIEEMGNMSSADTRSAKRQHERNLAYEQDAINAGINIQPIFADGRALPFKDGSLFEVLLRNVIGDQNVGENTNDLTAIVKEALRVSVDSSAVFMETYTPDVAAKRLSVVVSMLGCRVTMAEVHYQQDDNGCAIGLEERFNPTGCTNYQGLSKFHIFAE